MGEKLETTPREAGLVSSESSARLRQFLHDVATPLSAVALHLEAASRKVTQGEDPSRSLEIARTELAHAFELFERGRDDLLGRPGSVPEPRA